MLLTNLIYIIFSRHNIAEMLGGHHGCDRMVVGFTTTCAYHH